MAIDTTALIAVGRPREVVAAYLRDPANDPLENDSAPPLGAGPKPGG